MAWKGLCQFLCRIGKTFAEFSCTFGRITGCSPVALHHRHENTRNDLPTRPPMLLCPNYRQFRQQQSSQFASLPLPGFGSRYAFTCRCTTATFTVAGAKVLNCTKDKFKFHPFTSTYTRAQGLVLEHWIVYLLLLHEGTIKTKVLKKPTDGHQYTCSLNRLTRSPSIKSIRRYCLKTQLCLIVERCNFKPNQKKTP